MTLDEKYTELQKILNDLGSVLVAFSGGVDSTFLAKVAHEQLHEKAQAVTAWSENYPEFCPEELQQLVNTLGVEHHAMVYDEFTIPFFQQNTVERCYHCKRHLFTQFQRIAAEQGLQYVIDGSNVDDVDDFRPGMKALKELGIRSPLKEAGLSKEEIRQLSKRFELPTWNKPSMPCLATRVPYDIEITPTVLHMISEAEALLRQLGFVQIRVRHHGNIARIEVLRNDMKRIFQEDLDEQIVSRFKEIGYQYVTLDLQGFRSGSMNEVLK